MAGIVRMTVLGVVPRPAEDLLCPFCGGDPLELVVAWSDATTPFEVEVGGYCENPDCDTFFLEGPD